jgi:hypothetical protein
MRRKEFKKRFVLNKKTIANLSKEDLDSVKGGALTVFPLTLCSATITVTASISIGYWCSLCCPPPV